MRYEWKEALNTFFDELGVSVEKREEVLEAIKNGYFMKPIGGIVFRVGVSVERRSNTRFLFRGVMDVIGGYFLWTNALYVEMDKTRKGSLDNMIKNRHKNRYDMFEFVNGEKCIYAFD